MILYDMIFKYPSGGSADYYCQELGLWFPSEIISNNSISSSSSSKIKHEQEKEKKEVEENKSMDVEKENEGENKYTHKIELVYSIGNDLNGHLIKGTAEVFYPTDRSPHIILFEF
jgi:hypothetical protein